MKISVDYDDTFTRDPIGWSQFIKLMVSRGHSVFIVTWRSEAEAKEVHEEMNYYQVPLDGIYATDRIGKHKFMAAQGIIIDVWIDDFPACIINDGEKYNANSYDID